MKKGLQHGYNWGIPLNSGHPYFEDNNYRQDNNSRTKLLNFTNYKAELRKQSNSQIIENFINYYYGDTDYQTRQNISKSFYYGVNDLIIDFESFKEIQNFINEQDKIITDSLSNLKTVNLHYHSQKLPEILTDLKKILQDKQSEIISFQEKYGLNDADKERQAKYKEIIEKPETLYRN